MRVLVGLVQSEITASKIHGRIKKTPMFGCIARWLKRVDKHCSSSRMLNWPAWMMGNTRTSEGAVSGRSFVGVDE